MSRMLLFSTTVCVFILAFLFYVSPVSHAQILPGLGSVSLIAQPQFPAPGEQVTVALNDYSVDSLGTTIVWQVNGTEFTSAKDERSITLTAGSIGTKTTVKVSLLRNGTIAYSATHTIVPSVVDIITEAYTHIPSFYKGRALPSVNAPVRVTALMLDGSKNSASYIYKWSYDGSVLFGGPMKGKQSVVVETPRFGDEYLQVEVFDTQGTLIGKGMTLLQAIEPELHFYEWSALRGLVGKEIKTPYELFGNEATVYAEPYYFDARMSTQDADFSWKINGNTVSGNAGEPNSLTLMREGENGRSYVDFSAVTKKQMPQLVKYGFEVFFE